MHGRRDRPPPLLSALLLSDRRRHLLHLLCRAEEQHRLRCLLPFLLLRLRTELRPAGRDLQCSPGSLLRVGPRRRHRLSACIPADLRLLPDGLLYRRDLLEYRVRRARPHAGVLRLPGAPSRNLFRPRAGHGLALTGDRRKPRPVRPWRPYRSGRAGERHGDARLDSPPAAETGVASAAPAGLRQSGGHLQGTPSRAGAESPGPRECGSRRDTQDPCGCASAPGRPGPARRPGSHRDGSREVGISTRGKRS